MTYFRIKFSFVPFMLLLAVCTFWAAPVYAANADKDLGALLPDSADKQIGPVYLQMTYPNLFRLAWAMGAYKTSDKEALDSYLKVTECTLYKKFFNNEFEWEKIRKAATIYLDTYGKQVSMYYEYIQPLLLGRYDDSLQGFPLERAADYISLKTLQVANFKPGETTCGLLPVDPYKYPAGAAVNIISPLSLTFVRVPKNIAEEYIAWRAKQGLTNADKRQAYIKYRVRIDGLNGKQKVAGGNSFIFSGRLMQVDVFADKEMLMPIYNQLF